MYGIRRCRPWPRNPTTAITNQHQELLEFIIDYDDNEIRLGYNQGVEYEDEVNKGIILAPKPLGLFKNFTIGFIEVNSKKEEDITIDVYFNNILAYSTLLDTLSDEEKMEFKLDIKGQYLNGIYENLDSSKRCYDNLRIINK